MIIPPERLTEQVLKGLLEAYITREGTDYGETELSLAQKVDQLLPLVYTGEVMVCYDEVSESTTLLTRHELSQQHSGGRPTDAEEYFSTVGDSRGSTK